jgi:hypothetical protein
VALARKLLVALWQYLETGAVAEGAETRSWDAKEESEAAAQERPG